MVKKRRNRKFKKRTTSPGECYFCQAKKEPDYKNISDLEKFTTDRGKIVANSYSGLCQKHQRRLAEAIKRARFLAFLPFVTRI